MGHGQPKLELEGRIAAVEARTERVEAELRALIAELESRGNISESPADVGEE
jgi:hypothetical protein